MNTKSRFLQKIGLVLLAYIAFISLGMPDGLMGVGWPSIRNGFNVPLDSLGLFMFASTTGYLTSSFMSGFFLRKIGIGGVLSASCALTGLALFSYTFVPFWWMMALLGIFGGFGAGAIDAGLNTYAADHFSEGLMQWLHAFYGIGITSGPLIMTYGLTTLNSWRFGYRIVGSFQILLAICFIFSIKSWGQKYQAAKTSVEKKTPANEPSYRETLKQPEVWLSMLLFMIYIGVEMGLGAWAYTLLTESRGIDPKTAGFWAGSFYGLFTIGRILAGLYAKRIGVNKIILISLCGAILGAVMLLLNILPVISLIGVVMIGFFIAPIFAALMSGTSSRVGSRYTTNTIGMQMAACGLAGAFIPTLIGVLARHISLEVIPVILVVLLSTLIVVYLVSMKRTHTLELARTIEIQTTD